MNIALVDDMPHELTKLTDIIYEYMSENNNTAEITTFQNAEDFLAAFRPFRFTLIFMDIYMNEMTGIDAAKKIRETDQDTLIVFLTTSTSHAFDAFDVHAYQYIAKSSDYNELKSSIFKVLSDIMSMQSIEEGKLIFSSNDPEQYIFFSNIVYVQSARNYVNIIDRLHNINHIRMTFSELCSILEKDNRFLKINRGIIINMEYITSFENNVCELMDIHQVPINVHEYKELNQIRKNYVFSKLHNKKIPGGIY